jgi:hypothetical protein
VLGRGESVLFFEVKSEKGKVTAAQREWSYNLSSHFVVRPSDWPHVQAVLK